MRKKKESTTVGLRNRQIAIFRWAMLGPGITILFLINILPIADTLYTSLFDYYLPMPQNEKFVGLGNYIQLFSEPRFLQSLGRTLLFMLMVVTAETILGFSIALVLTSKAFGTKIFRGILILPIMLTPIAAAFMWRIMYSPTLGVLNYFLEVLGIPPQKWIYGAEQALPSIAVKSLHGARHHSW